MTDAIRWVGLDVHAAQTTVAAIDKVTGEIHRAKLRGSPVKVLDFLAGYDGRLIAAYEAGPTGMTLARQARARGIDMRVCAPGLIPRKPTTASRPTTVTPRTSRASVPARTVIRARAD